MLGHASVATPTDIYADLLVDHVDAAFAALDDARTTAVASKTRPVDSAGADSAVTIPCHD